MLTQLDLFGEEKESGDDAAKGTDTKKEKLTPPSVIHVQSPEPTPLPEEPEKLVSEGELSKPAIKKSNRGRKSIREMSLEAARIDIPEDDILYSKQYYSIGDVAAMFQVNASLLRYWESEFDLLKLRKNRKGDRFFRPDDIKSLKLIHHLLRERKYTIEGAKDFLKRSNRTKEKFEAIEALKRIRSFLHEMKTGLAVDKEI